MPADEADRAAAQDADIGEQIDAGDGLFLKVTSVDVDGDTDQPYFVLDMRAENRGGDDQDIPELAVVCAGSTEPGGWLAGSTFPMYDTVRAGSFAEGRLELLGPDDSRTGEPTPKCKDSAVIRVNIGNDGVDSAIPDRTLAAFNDKIGS